MSESREPPLPPEVEVARQEGVRQAYRTLGCWTLVALPLFAVWIIIVLWRIAAQFTPGL